jgi:hypothetical protein
MIPEAGPRRSNPALNSIDDLIELSMTVRQFAESRDVSCAKRQHPEQHPETFVQKPNAATTLLIWFSSADLGIM